MSFVTDDFISYNEELLVKQEKLSIDDDSYIGSSTSESTPPYPSSMNQALQNLLSTNDQSLTLEPFSYASLFSAPPKRQPFKISKFPHSILHIHIKFSQDPKTRSSKACH